MRKIIRAKRQKTLEQLANRLAAKVVKTKKYVRLEPMNPYERKIIHATLQKNPNIITRSEGEEPYRKSYHRTEKIDEKECPYSAICVWAFLI